MRALTPEYWESFHEIRPDGKKYFDGVKFENLVRDILASDFEGNWEHTQATWDGGKDFIDRSFHSSESWVECKMYEKPLSISKISNSLILAINNQNVQHIIFFSYSALNQNAVYHLASFAATTSINVQIFDDVRLEYLILKNDLILKKFFATFSRSTKQVFSEDLEIFNFFTKEANVEYAQVQNVTGVTKRSTISLTANTPCLYEISIRAGEKFVNRLVRIDVSLLRKQRKALGWLNFEKLKIDKSGLINHKLKPGQVNSLKFYLAPVKIGKLRIPEVIIETDYNQKYTLPPLPVEVSPLNYPPLIGSSVLNALNLFRQKISANSTIRTTIVSGKSGVGKSRFLDEAKLRLLIENYIPLNIDGNSSYCKDFSGFSKNLLSQVWRLPNPKFLDEHIRDIPVVNTGTYSVFDKVCSLLYSAEQNNRLGATDDVFELVVYGLLRQKMAVLIDNVQSLDSNSLLLIRRLVYELTDQTGLNIFVLSFNTEELIYSEGASLLYWELKNSYAFQTGGLDFFELGEFSPEAVEMFINTICGRMDDTVSFSDHYPKLVQLIIQNVLPRPLDIYQLFLAAQDNDPQIAVIKNGFFFVNDIDKFHSLITHINGKTQRIFEIRLVNLFRRENCLKILLLLCSAGEFDSSLAVSVTNTSHLDIQFLINGGWLRRLDGDYIGFFHPALSKYVTTVFANDKIEYFFPKKMQHELADSLVRINDNKLYSLSVFILSEVKSDENLFAALEQLRTLKRSAVTPLIGLYARNIYTQILLRDKNPKEYLDLVELVCKFSAEGVLSDFVLRLKEIRGKLNRFIPTDDGTAFKLFKLTRQFASFGSGLGKAAEGDELLKKDLKLISSLPDSISKTTRDRLTVNLLNRRCVCLKDLGEMTKAEYMGRTSYELSKKENFHDFVCLNLIDLSGVYKNKKQDQEKFIFYVDKALEYFVGWRETIGDQSIELSCLENEARVECLRNKLDSAIKLTDKYLRLGRTLNDNGSIVRGLAMKATLILKRSVQGKHSYNDYNNFLLKVIIYELEDLSIIIRSDKFYLKSLHLHAIRSTIDNKIEESQQFYTAALKKIKDKINSEKLKFITPTYEAIVLDAINFWAKYLRKETFPLNHSIFREIGLDHLYPVIVNRQTINPMMLFCNDGYNFPLL